MMRATFFVGILATVALPATAQTLLLPEPGSYAARAVEGGQLAAERCLSCHMILQGQGNDMATPFAIIAARRSPDQVRAFLAGSHGDRVATNLSAEQIEDIISYIRSLGVGLDAWAPLHSRD
jgi:mono/diheme cytochrome c family protein